MGKSSTGHQDGPQAVAGYVELASIGRAALLLAEGRVILHCGIILLIWHAFKDWLANQGVTTSAPLSSKGREIQLTGSYLVASLMLGVADTILIHCYISENG